jgi:dTDP-4-amino-4,6-dideoxygalactose transaminase
MFRYSSEAFGGHSRAELLRALRAEGIPASAGYTEPLQRSPAVVAATAALCRQLGRADDPLARPLPVTERASGEEGVWLTQRLLLADETDVRTIPAAIRKIQAAWTR